jgi:hypothetical protein
VVILPDNGDAMRSVLAGEAQHPGKALRPDVLEADQADASDSVTVVQLWPERRRELTLNDLRLDPEVH